MADSTGQDKFNALLNAFLGIDEQQHKQIQNDFAQFVERKEYEYGYYDYHRPRDYARMFHEEAKRFAPEIGLPETSRIALETALQQESGGDFDARPMRKVKHEDGTVTLEPMTTAFGGMQILDKQWNTLVQRYPQHLKKIDGIDDDKIREHPVGQARASELLAWEDLKAIQKAIPDRDFTQYPLDGGETYILHWQGAPTAKKILTAKDDTLLSTLVSKSTVEHHAKFTWNGRKFADWTVADTKAWALDTMQQHLGTAVNVAAKDGADINTLLAYDDALRGKTNVKQPEEQEMTTSQRLLSDSLYVGGKALEFGWEASKVAAYVARDISVDAGKYAWNSITGAEETPAPSTLPAKAKAIEEPSVAPGKSDLEIPLPTARPKEADIVADASDTSLPDHPPIPKAKPTGKAR